MRVLYIFIWRLKRSDQCSKEQDSREGTDRSEREKDQNSESKKRGYNKQRKRKKEVPTHARACVRAVDEYIYMPIRI